MSVLDHDHNHDDESVEIRAQAELRSAFKKMKNKVSLVLFSDPLVNETFSQSARTIIRFIREMTDKVDLREFDLTHKKAKKYDVIYSPTLIFNPEKYNIRWLGAPIGEEGRTFIEALIMMGYGRSNVSDESLEILNRIESPRNIKVFVSGSCPYCPQQAVNCIKAAFERPDIISLEIIDILANPELAEKYAAQSVPQTYANEQLIAQGAQQEELFMASLEKMEQQTIFIPENDAPEIEADLVIIGGGPAGLTAGIYSTRSGLNTVIVEKDTLGGQVATTPIVENYPGLTQVGGKTLVDLMVSHALEYVQIFPDEEVMTIQPGERIMVSTNKRRFYSKAVLMATGARHRKLDVPGESHLSGHGISYCATCDGPLFKDKKVIIVGGGDSAVTEALHMHNIGVEVSLVHRRDKLRAQNHLISSIENMGIPVYYNTEVKEIIGTARVEKVVLFNNKKEKKTTLDIDGVFISVGYEPAVDLARAAGVEVTSEGYIRHDSRHRTNIPGIYSAGDVEGGFKQIVTAAGQGSEAALSIFEDLMNPYWKKEEV